MVAMPVSGPSPKELGNAFHLHGHPSEGVMAKGKRKSRRGPATRLTDHQRCRKAWISMWFGVIGLLENQEPRAFARLREKLKRHGLIGGAVTKPDRTGRYGETDSLEIGLIPSKPSDTFLERAAAFSADDTPVPLQGRMRPRPPTEMIVASYVVALARAQKEPKDSHKGVSAADRAYQRAAEAYGYGVETCRKEVKRARRQVRDWLRANRPRRRP
jgi:hypothetical protein